MSWNDERVQNMRLWIRQLVSFSFLYFRAARWYRFVSVLSTGFDALVIVYTLPGYGCGLVTGQVCEALQWTGIVFGILGGVNSILSRLYDPDARRVSLEKAGNALMKLSRKIDSELAKDATERVHANELREGIIDNYDDIVDNARLPWFISGEQQLANISLLQGYVVGGGDDVERGPRDAMLQITPADVEVMKQIQHELRRLADSDESEEK